MTGPRMRNYCEIAERLVPQAFRTGFWRRTFVVLGNVLALATIASAALDLGDVAVLLGLGAGFGIAMSYGATLVPAGAMTGREAAVRDRAHREAFNASYVLLPAALIAAPLVAENGGVQVLWAVLMACLAWWALPSSLIAWQLRDEELIGASVRPDVDTPAPATAPVSSSGRAA